MKPISVWRIYIYIYIYCSLADTTYKLFWLLRLLQDLVVLIAYATRISSDNLSVIQIAHNNAFFKIPSS